MGFVSSWNVEMLGSLVGKSHVGSVGSWQEISLIHEMRRGSGGLICGFGSTGMQWDAGFDDALLVWDAWMG